MYMRVCMLCVLCVCTHARAHVNGHTLTPLRPPLLTSLFRSGNTTTLVGGLMTRVLKISLLTYPLWLMSFCTSGIMTCGKEGVCV